MEERSYFYDLHCHTTESSDAPGRLKNIVRIAKKRGLDGIAITNHNKVYNGEEEIDGISIIPSVEISVGRGNHLLGYFVKKNIEEKQGFQKSITEIHNQGGYAVWAHPMREKDFFEEGSEDVFPILDGMESGNGMDSDEEQAVVSEICKQHNLIETAGSDVHTEGQVGIAVIKVSKKLTKENFVETIRGGKIIVREEFLKFRKENRQIREKIPQWKGVFAKRESKMLDTLFAHLFLRNYLRFVNIKLRKVDIDYKKEN
jgi:hypothetical protein